MLGLTINPHPLTIIDVIETKLLVTKGRRIVCVCVCVREREIPELLQVQAVTDSQNLSCLPLLSSEWLSEEHSRKLVIGYGMGG